MVAVCMAVYHLFSTQIVLFSHIPFLNIHLAFGLSVVFLQAAQREERTRYLFLLALALGLLAVAYIHIEADALVDREGFPTSVDTAIGLVIIVLVLAASHLAFGPVFPIMALIGIGYAFAGPWLPGAFFHGGIEPVRLIAMLTTDLSGIYGTLLFISATYMVVFLVFGSFIENSGVAKFFIDLPLALFRGKKAGGGYAAVMASAMMGMGSGSPVANVVTTGTFTIPLMKRQGFHPHVAGAIEAAASTGGQIMPPVMGAVAFVMAEFTSTPYVKIMGYAAIPAILYFWTVGLSVHFRAHYRDLKAIPVEELPRLRDIMGGWKYFLPIAALVFIMVLGYTPYLAAFWAALLLAAMLGLEKSEAGYTATLLRCLDNGGRRAAEFAAGMACIAIFVKIIMATGVGLKLPLLVAEYSQGNLLLAYVMTAIASAILGMGVPTVPAYIVVAVIVVPALMKLGAQELPAHFFVLYYSILSALTPPVALAALAGAKLAGANYWKTAWESMRYGYVAFFVPFLFAYNPALMGLGTPYEIFLAAAGAFFATTAAAACLQGYFIKRATLPDRLLFLASAVFFTADVVTPTPTPFFIGLVLLGAAIIKQIAWPAGLFQAKGAGAAPANPPRQ
ncbi:MAG: TRAP transporter fused permease subunit [Candidatus Tectomicrobia bacterium]|uniref:TRAP transporter fused permease subunit n=1 Tax=Tectimicrobiota bacterium TaxID=2528274 RepID=A0A932MNU0_UNCTE|nr:TRAP transporter fused permease subunit [Candidatus Tectomicrobia bacterium]